MKNKIRNMKGFTLVELLIVIALIAILSVAVLSTINPIEQSNKARDAKFQNDASELVSAFERYYTSQNTYPWNSTLNTDPVAVVNNTNSIAFLAKDKRFGVVNLAATVAGHLIQTYELKSAFSGKEPFGATGDIGDDDAMYLFHDNDSNYVCFCPKSNANKTGTKVSNLKCLRGVTATDAVAAANSAELFDAKAGTACTEPTATEIKAPTFCNIPAKGTASYANMICVPEGLVGLADEVSP